MFLYVCLATTGGIADYQRMQIRALTELDRGPTLVVGTRKFIATLRPSSGRLRLSRLYLVDVANRPFAGRRILGAITLLLGYALNYTLVAALTVIRRPRSVIFSSFAEYGAPLWRRQIRFAARLSGSRLAAVVHDAQRQIFSVGSSVRLYKWPRQAAECFDLLVAHSPLTEEWATRPQITVPFGPYFFGPPMRSREEVRKELGINEDHLLIVSLGNIRDDKGIDLVIESMSLDPKLRYVVAGKVQNSRQRPIDSYLRLAEAYGVLDRCIFIDRYLEEAEIVCLVAAADASLAVYSDTFTSASATVALAAGYQTPTIGYFGPGHSRDVVDRYALGQLLRSRDVAALAEALAALIPGERLDTEAYSRDCAWQRNLLAILDGLETPAEAGHDRSRSLGALGGD